MVFFVGIFFFTWYLTESSARPRNYDSIKKRHGACWQYPSSLCIKTDVCPNVSPDEMCGCFHEQKCLSGFQSVSPQCLDAQCISGFQSFLGMADPASDGLLFLTCFHFPCGNITTLSHSLYTQLNENIFLLYYFMSENRQCFNQTCLKDVEAYYLDAIYIKKYESYNTFQDRINYSIYVSVILTVAAIILYFKIRAQDEMRRLRRIGISNEN